MNDPKDFPFPLDVDIEEQVPVKRISVDDIDMKKGIVKTSVKTTLEKQTVRYMNVPKQKIRCPASQHVYRILSAKKWLFGCTKCPFARRVFPHTHKFDPVTGIIIHRATGQRV